VTEAVLDFGPSPRRQLADFSDRQSGRVVVDAEFVRPWPCSMGDVSHFDALLGIQQIGQPSNARIMAIGDGR
jgi:hypothetical protein